MKNTKHCSGCRNNFYNGTGAKECWSLRDARVVKRWRIGWWTTPTTPGAFTEVETYQCHSALGQYSLSEKLPDFAVEPRRLSKVMP